MYEVWDYEVWEMRNNMYGVLLLYFRQLIKREKYKKTHVILLLTFSCNIKQ